MLKTETKTCTSCSAAFEAVDTSNEAAWTYVFTAFPGDWTWMVLGRLSKAVLPECAGNHSLDICPACLPKLMFSGLEIVDGVSGSGDYRFVCTLCKHNFSPVQVERIARLIDPTRTPTTLSGISISSNSALSSAAKPVALPKTVASLLGPANKLKPLGGGPGLSQATESDNSSHKESLMNAIVSKKPNVRWNDVAGLTPAKHELQRAIVFPARFPNLYDEKRKASGAILLYGPPGTGKSYLAKAIATEVDHTLFSISSGDVVSKWVGESEKYFPFPHSLIFQYILLTKPPRLVRQLFTLARENKPSIIFIDEIDALCSHREGGSGGGGSADRGSEHSSRMKTEILVQLDGLHAGGGDNSGVVVLAATNLPWSLDPAFRRRFEPRIYIPLPDKEARKQLFGIHAGKWGDLLTEEDVEELANMTEGYSGSDIANVIKHALSVPLQKVQSARFFRKTGPAGAEMYTPCEGHEEGAVEMTWENVPKNRLREPPVTAAAFKQVLRDRRVKSSVGVGELQRYENWTREFGVEGNS
jgi:vacuolar protein-sorting-associated protein 4